jgi:hypothetical protein
MLTLLWAQQQRLAQVGAATVLVCWLAAQAAYAEAPLPSWNDGPSKKAILEFVAKVTDKASDAYVPPHERIATFDNDGTLWVEKPVYTQIEFVFDRIRELAPQHPEWKDKEPFKSVLAGELEEVAAGGNRALMELLMVTHAGMTAEEFAETVSRWIATAKHPRFKKLYTQCIYVPQLELLKYLRANQFKTFIVSGGGIAFMRPWTLKTYGISPAQVVGSSIVAEFEITNDGEAVLVRKPKINFIDDKEGKPVGILHHIGQRPILAFGNADADMQMLQYTTGGKGARLGLVVHHTDAKREYAYDRHSTVGRLDKVLDIADENGWIIVSMKTEWNRIFPFDKPNR